MGGQEENPLKIKGFLVRETGLEIAGWRDYLPRDVHIIQYCKPKLTYHSTSQTPSHDHRGHDGGTKTQEFDD